MSGRVKDSRASMSHALPIALGRKPITLSVPDGVEVIVPRPVIDAQRVGAAEEEKQLREALTRPESGRPLGELMKGKRRISVLVGDSSFPAPYAYVLPKVRDILIELGIRPSRISFVCCPGTSDTVLGASVVRRYGEEIAGDHEVRAWDQATEGPAETDSHIEKADLKIAVLPDLQAAAHIIPASGRPDVAICFSCGRGARQLIEGVRVGEPNAVLANAGDQSRNTEETDFQVKLVTGGGAPTDATLEESLASLRLTRDLRAPAEGESTTILSFWGGDGLGSSRFTLDLWSVLEQCEERLAASDTQRERAQNELVRWYPEDELANAISRGNVILFAPGLAKQSDWDDLCERLASHQNLSRRCKAFAVEDEVWSCLEQWHTSSYRMHAEPLGWRAVAR